jgi:hypothetical protein
VQQANALVQASAQTLSIGGWALAAALLAVVPVSVFFGPNAASFFVSALLISHVRRRAAARQAEAEAGMREGFATLRPRTTLAIGVLVLGVAVAISSGTWIGGGADARPRPSA